jgi:hypothetical protein
MSVGKAEGTRPPGRLRGKCEKNKTDLKEIVCEGADWIHLAQDSDQRRAVVNAAKKFRGLIKC